MKTSKELLLELYDLFYQCYGPQYWWPADSTLEVIIGALLTQNTTWSNASKAIQNLKKHNLIDIDQLIRHDQNKLAAIIKPSGYYNQKAKRLILLAKYLSNNTQNNIQDLFNKPMHILREELLSLEGVGPETADSILLYGGDMPIFVVDAYTKRIFKRHGIISGDETYEEIRVFAESNLPKDINIYQEFHALIVKAGSTHCTPNTNCKDCPANQWRNFYIQDLKIPYNQIAINHSKENPTL